MKELTNSLAKSFKENLIKFKDDLIMKNKINKELRKILIVIMEKKDLRVLKISDIYLMKKMSLYMKISGICLMNESPFKPIITNNRSNLPKRGHKLIKNSPKYAEEKDLTYSQVKSFKEKLTKFNNDLIKKKKLRKILMIIMKNIKLKLKIFI